MSKSNRGGARRRGILFIVSAPSGAGKTTLVGELVARDPQIQVSVSHTTRAPRPHETDGVSYHFTDEAAFVRMIGENAFLEHARVFDNRYGTSRDWVEGRLAAGIDVILEIDWQGAKQVRTLAPGSVGIFVLPPSLPVLRQRLLGRGDDERAVARRMQDARTEISHFDEYDYVIVNDSRDDAFRDLEAIVRASRRSCPLQRQALVGLIAELLQPADAIK
jgi:guanylate kinase